MKKGFTIVELVISMALFSIILVATSSIFVTALKNYQINITKSDFQKEVNFSLDDINKNIKLAIEVPLTYGSYSLSQNILILALPTTDSSANFIYEDGAPLKDYVIYYSENGNLHKVTHADPSGIRANQNGEDKIILGNLTNVNYSYFPGLTGASQVEATIEVGKIVQKTNIKIEGKRLANLRNKQ